MISALSVVVIVQAALLARIAIRSLLRGDRSALLVAVLVFEVYFSLPVLIDLVVGPPHLGRFPRMSTAASHGFAREIYLLFTLYAQTIFWIGLRSRRSRPTRRDLRPLRSWASRGVRGVLWALLAMPLAFALLSPRRSVYLDYTPYARGLSAYPAAARHHVWVSQAVQLALLAAAMLVATGRTGRLRRQLAAIAPLLASAVWLNGKRNAVAFALALILFALWRRADVDRRKLARVAAGALLCFGTYSVYYQSELRFPEAFQARRDVEDERDELRIDYGRDAVLKLSIFSRIDDEVPSILDYPGQSVGLVYHSLTRRDEPSYPNRLTSVAYGYETPGRGGLTTSIFDEALSNFGFLGLLAAPWIIVAAARWGDRAKDELVSLLTIFVVIAAMSVHLPAWLPVFAAWLTTSVVRRQRLRHRGHSIRIPASMARATT